MEREKEDEVKEGSEQGGKPYQAKVLDVFLKELEQFSKN